MSKKTKTKRNIKRVKGIKIPRKAKYIVGIFVLVVLCVIFSRIVYHQITTLLQNKHVANTSQQQVIPDATTTKNYYNNDLLISYDVPANWTINSYKDQYGFEQYDLTSADNLAEITSTIPDTNSYSGYPPLKELNLQLGKYTNVIYSTYTNEPNNVLYGIQLNGIDRQEDIHAYVRIKGDFKTNNARALAVLKTFRYTQQEPLPDDIIAYVIPAGWEKNTNPFYKKNPVTSVLLYSPDATFSENSPYLQSGAQININISRRVGTIDQSGSDPTIGTNIVKQQIAIDGHEGTLFFHCYEGCGEGYTITTDKYVLTVSFQCVTYCDSKADTDQSKYAKDRDYLINSIKFK